MIVRRCPATVGDTVERLLDLLEARGVKLFARTRSRGELAARYGLSAQLAARLSAVEALADALAS